LCVVDRDQQGLGFDVACEFARGGLIVVLADVFDVCKDFPSFCITFGGSRFLLLVGLTLFVFELWRASLVEFEMITIF
jgi:hypothetical protein